MKIYFISFHNTWGINSKLLQDPLCKSTAWVSMCIFFQSILRKQSFRGVLKKMCSENRQQIYRRTPWGSVISKCDFLEFSKEFFGQRVEWVDCTISLLSHPARKINARFYLIKDFDVIYAIYHLLNSYWKYLIRINFDAEKIWRNCRKMAKIAKLNPQQM